MEQAARLDQPKTLAQIIKDFQKRTGMSQPEIARLVEERTKERCTRMIINSWARRGLKESKKVRALSEVLGIPVQKVEEAAELSNRLYRDHMAAMGRSL